VTSFIILCAVMLVAAVALVAYPLLRPAPQAVKGQPLRPPATIPALAIGLAVVLGAIAMYHHSSNFPWQNPESAAAVPSGHGDGGNGGSMEAVMKQLEARLQANPVDLEGWRMLARTYLVTGQAGKAVDAYEKAIQIAGDSDPSLQLDLAEALVLTNEAALQERAKGIFAATLAADPRSQKALWYSGVIAIRAGDKQTAIKCWSKLLEQNPPDEIRQILVAQLAELGVTVPAVAPGANPAPPAAGPVAGAQGGDAAAPAPQGRTIRVAVSLDPSLAGKVPPGTTLFVSAREPGIPGPPLAAVRLTSDVLPTTVVLSDANSMIEGRNLSSVADVEVVAHVALAGAPMTSSGDLVGTAIQKKGGAADVKVAIDKVQP
jgi:cytochrome c-type biogenesis protein CcmH